MTTTDIKIKAIDEGHIVQMVRNALLVAGTEMGVSGDHWPVIKSTIHQIARDWEDVKIERNVNAEMKIHLYEQLQILEKDLPNYTAAQQALLAPELKALRETYDAYFTPLDGASIYVADHDMPKSIQRAQAIIATLEEQDA